MKKRKNLNTDYKLSFQRMSIIAVFVFAFEIIFKLIETLSKLRIMAVFTAFLMPLLDEVKRKRKNSIEVYWNMDKKSAAIN
ncbi:MAG: hypothetical protein AAGU75_20865 [Bacillota bacterium]